MFLVSKNKIQCEVTVRIIRIALCHELDDHIITYAGNGCFQMNVLKCLNVPLCKQKQSCKPTNLACFKHLPSEIPFRVLASHCKHILNETVPAGCRTTLDGMLKTKSTDTCSPVLLFCQVCSVEGDLRHQVYLCGGGAGGKVCIVRDKRRPVLVHC